MRKVLLVLLSITSLAGCASTMGIGKTEYGCKGIPGHQTCSTAEDNYKKTDGDLSESPWQQETASKRVKIKRGKDGRPLPIIKIKRSKEVLLPKQHNPIPIRTPARVLRIWIAPWEDKSGDLHMASLVYSEIEKRRWVVGEKVGDGGLGVGVWLPAQ